MAAERLHPARQARRLLAAGAPKLDGLKFNIVPESATRQVGLASGQYALLPNIDAATALQLKGKPNVKLQETLELAYTLVGMNVVEAALRQPEGARGAELRPQPRRRSSQAALFGAGVPGGPLSPALEGLGASMSSEFPCYTPDPAKAQALLEGGGRRDAGRGRR